MIADAVKNYILFICQDLREGIIVPLFWCSIVYFGLSTLAEVEEGPEVDEMIDIFTFILVYFGLSTSATYR